MRKLNQAKYFGTFTISVVLLACDNLSPAQPPANPKTSETPTLALIATGDCQVRAGDSDLQKLLKARVRSAISEWRLEFDFTGARGGQMDDGADVGRRILEARLAMANNPSEQLAVRQQYVEYARNFEGLNQVRFNAGAIKQHDLERTKYFRLDAEIQVLRLGGTLPEDKTPVPPERATPAPPANSDPPPDERHLTEFVKTTPFAITPDEPLLRKLLKGRANSATTEVRLRDREHVIGRGTFESLFDSACRARDSRLQLANTAAERLEVLTQYRDFTLAIDELNLARWQVGALRERDLLKSRFHRAYAEMAYARVTASPEDLTKLRIPGPPVLFAQLLPYSEGNEVEFIRSKYYAHDEADMELQRLPKECADCANKEAYERFHEFLLQRNDLGTLLDSGHRARDARLQLAKESAQSREILTQYLGFTQAIEKFNQSLFDQGALRQQDLERSRFERLSAEIDLLRAKTK